MPGGFSNKPKILRGAFVEYGLSIPPLAVPFQFNPVQVSRNRSLSFGYPGQKAKSKPEGVDRQADSKPQGVVARGPSLREWHQEKAQEDLTKLRDAQKVTVQEESISFDIRLDATDRLNDGDLITEQFGIAPQLATLELMVLPQAESFIETLLTKEFPDTFSFSDSPNPPLVLFIWGRKRVLPVNINEMRITETEFSTDLNPIRATVSVSLTAIEGRNPVYTYTKSRTEAMSVLNLANLTNVTDVVIPG